MSKDEKSLKRSTHRKTSAGTLGNGGGDPFDLPLIDEDVVLTGAAADSTGLADRLKSLPRILRTALLVDARDSAIHDRLIADIATLYPELSQNLAFAATGDPSTARALASELDKRAVGDDVPELRHLADCIRLLTIPMMEDLSASADYRRVTLSLFNALKRLPEDIDPQLAANVETFCVGWAVLPVLKHRVPRYRQSRSAAAEHASFLGNMTATRRIEAAEASVWAAIEPHGDDQKSTARDPVEIPATALADVRQAATTPPHHCVVARLSDGEMKSMRLKEIMPLFKDVINTPLPLIETPPLQGVRQALMLEFPYAQDVIDTVLSDLVGRATIFLRPTLVLGKPGAGKSIFCRRLAQVLGVFCWRTDASRSDGGSAFAGTDRRWNSAEPSHPVLAIARAGHANPLMHIEELEKAGTRSDYGRFWDCLLGFCETESSARYPDPVLTDVDLSHVSYLATANSVTGLPPPLLDRLRVVTFPQPSPNHVDALMPSILAALARERGLDPIWFPPLDQDERAAVVSEWRGGSVRHLRRLVEVILRDREGRATKN